MMGVLEQRITGCALMLCVLSGCSTTTEVHVYGEYLSRDARVGLTDLLAEEDFRVVFNTLPVPDGIRHTTLIYSPLNNNSQRANLLVDILGETEYGVPRLGLTGEENHFYSTGVLGLYLVPQGKIPDRAAAINQAFAVEYNGRCETVDVSLNLRKNGTLELVSDMWDEKLDKGYSVSREGLWTFSDRKIFLTLDGDMPVGFEASRFEKQNGPGGNKMAVIELNNTGDAPFYDGCDFVYQVIVY